MAIARTDAHHVFTAERIFLTLVNLLGFHKKLFMVSSCNLRMMELWIEN